MLGPSDRILQAIQSLVQRLGPATSLSAQSLASLKANGPTPKVDGCSAPIYTLPEDAILVILALLDTGDLLACRQVCRLLSHIIESDVRLQYRIALAVSGMVNGSSTTDLTLPEKLQRLKDHRSLAHVPTHSPCDSGSWPEASTRVQVLASQGTLVYALHQPDGLKLDIRRPPARGAGGNAAPHCISVSLGHEAFIAAFDVSQDLLVSVSFDTAALEVTAHFLCMTSGAAHPKAAQPALRSTSERGLTLVQVFRHLVAWHTYTPGSPDRSVEIWNWHTGERVWSHTFRDQLSYAFLDTSYIILTETRQEELQVYCFSPPKDSRSPSLANPGNNNHNSPAAILELPLGAFRCAVHHEERGRFHSSSPRINAPFYPDPKLSLLAVRFAIYTPRLSTALLLVPRATIYNAMDLVRSPCRPHSRRAFWHEWGPQGGLLLNLSGPDIVPRVVYTPYGSRAAILVQDKWRKARAHVVIFDLNPWAVRRSSARNVAGRVNLVQDLSGFHFRVLRATVPHIAYWGPSVLFPNEHKPTALTMNDNGVTVLHEWQPPYQDKLGCGYQTFFA